MIQCYCQIQLEIQTAAWADGEILMGKAIDDAWRDPSKLGSFSFYNVSNGRSEVPTQLPSQPLIHVDIPAQSRYPIYSSSTPIFIYQSTDNSAVSIRANLPTLTNRTAPRTQFPGSWTHSNCYCIR
ncbi:hypothetical protein QR685DRAFT_567796 [Neurospora intermedia]|uniref:Uncharacterized protein n=1 Tax=Neurospora intermedia TaxID=5142 RepID=A0ABR3DQI6_NEUIN